jgi:hypothetical protein
MDADFRKLMESKVYFISKGSVTIVGGRFLSSVAKAVVSSE